MYVCIYARNVWYCLQELIVNIRSYVWEAKGLPVYSIKSGHQAKYYTYLSSLHVRYFNKFWMGKTEK